MEPGSAHRLPFQRNVQRIIGELCHLIIIALVKADAFAAFNVNGRYYFDVDSPCTRCHSVLDMESIAIAGFPPSRE
jgi:hypothetical protein